MCLPAREEAATIGPIVTALVRLRLRGVIDEVVVVDAPSEDGTAALATDAGADVHRQEALGPSLGPVLGKGDAMWRALPVLRGDIVCFLDSNSEGSLRISRPASPGRCCATQICTSSRPPTVGRSRRAGSSSPLAAGACEERMPRLWRGGDGAKTPR